MKEEIIANTETWNNAKGFSAYFVLFPLIECRRLIKICLFGVEEIGQDVGTNKSSLNENKINAINRLLQELIQICEDNDFVFDKTTREKYLKPLANELYEIEKVIDGISYESTDQRNQTGQIEINKEHFDLCFRELRTIFSKVKTPLNMKNLIFPAGDDLDLDKLKEDIIEGG